jgi:phosphodiesterase/alkaline phosphatase D-like protein
VCSGRAWPDDGHSVHIEVDGLQPDREYWYRFYAGGEASAVGRTRTAPAFGRSPAQLRFCFVSCSQFEHGYFTAYGRIVEDDPAFLVHVGAGVRNAVVLTGDVHQHYAADLKADYADPGSPIVASELVATSITSGGDGNDTVQDAALRENPWIKFNANRRGYVRCTITRKQYVAEFRTLPYVSTPGAPAQTKAAFVLQDGQPGLQPA